LTYINYIILFDICQLFIFYATPYYLGECGERAEGYRMWTYKMFFRIWRVSTGSHISSCRTSQGNATSGDGSWQAYPNEPSFDDWTDRQTVLPNGKIILYQLAPTPEIQVDDGANIIVFEHGIYGERVVGGIQNCPSELPMWVPVA
jgi:hypothetical protein